MNPSVVKTNLPKSSILQTEYKSFKTIDSFQGSYQDKQNNITTTEVVKAFFSYAPSWVNKLLELRNRIVSIFGLKVPNTSDREKILNNFTGIPGEQIGLFKVFQTKPDEAILGEDDKHLDFRVSFLIEKVAGNESLHHLTISTAVKFNNWFGHFYFFFVKPFHKFVVPAMLRGILRSLDHN